MSTELRFENFDTLFDEGTHNKIIVNDYDGTSKEVKSYLDNLLMRNDLGDALSLKPSCVCGELQGAYYIGCECENCGCPVTSPLEEELTYLVWLRQPEGVAPFVTPFIMELLLRRYYISTPSVKLVEYIMLPNYRIKGLNRSNMHLLKKLDFLLDQAKIKRGYNSFVENFFPIIELLENNFSRCSKKDRGKFYDWLWSIREDIFSSWLPIPNRSLFVFDTNEMGSYIDRNVLSALTAVRRLTGIDILDVSQRKKEEKVAKAILDLTDFYVVYMEDGFFKKPGLFRKQIARTKSHYTMRAVIVSKTTPGPIDRIEIPWSATCSLLRPLIINGLRSRGFSARIAEEHFMAHVQRYCPIIDDIFREIIHNTGGIPFLLNRNPSLHRGSVLFVFADKVKTQVNDNSISMPPLNGPPLNADYDGDMVNLTLAITKTVMQGAENFRIHHNLLGLSGPNGFTGVISYPKSLYGTIYNWRKFDGDPNELVVGQNQQYNSLLKDKE